MTPDTSTTTDSSNNNVFMKQNGLKTLSNINDGDDEMGNRTHNRSSDNHKRFIAAAVLMAVFATTSVMEAMIRSRATPPF